MEQWSNGRLNTPTLHYSVILKFLRNRFELVTFYNVADLIFAEVAQLDAAFQPGPHFLHVILEAAQCRDAAIVNRLAFAHDPGARRAGDSPVGNQTTGHDPPETGRPVSPRRDR